MMFSSDKNMEQLRQLFVELREYVLLQKRYVQLDVASKMTIALSALVLYLTLFLIAMIVVLFLAMAGGAMLGRWLGSDAGGYGIIALFFVLLSLIIYKNRHRWIERPIARFLASLFLDKNKHDESSS